MDDRAAAYERLTNLEDEIVDTGQRHAAIRLLHTTTWCRRHHHLAGATDSEISHPMLAHADALDEVALLFALDVDANVTDATGKENLDILRQRLYLSTDYGGYNLTRQSDERYVAHYASLAASIRPLYELMLRHASNRFADDIRLAIAQPDPNQQWAATSYATYHATVHVADVPQDIIARAHRDTPHLRPAVMAGRQHTHVDRSDGYKRAKIPQPSELHTSSTMRFL